MSSTRFIPPVLVAAAAFASAAPALAQTVHARLDGYQSAPAVSSPGSGAFRAKIDKNSGSVFYELSYEGLQTDVFMSHIHIGQHGVNGGISVWLCGNPALGGTPPAGVTVPVCPLRSGTINGTFTAGSVVGPNAQLIAPGQFDELLAAIRAGVAYVNVHTTAASGGVPGGEIRGQIAAMN